MRFVSWVFMVVLSVLLGASLASAKTNELDGVKSFADNLASQALAVIRNNDLDKEAKQESLKTLFDSHVDIAWVGRFVLGKHWRAATPDQQAAYMTNYKTFILENYTSKLTNYTGQKYLIKSARTDGEAGEYLLTMELVNDAEPSVMIDYRIRKTGNDFKIFDIIVEGVSMITTQRSEFGSVVANKGLPFLIDALAKRAQMAAAK